MSWPPPPQRPQRAASSANLRRLGVWLGVAALLLGAAAFVAVWRNPSGLPFSVLRIVAGGLPLALFGLLAGAVLIVVGWERSSRDGRRKPVEWLVVGITLSATPIIAITVLWTIYSRIP